MLDFTERNCGTAVQYARKGAERIAQDCILLALDIRDQVAYSFARLRMAESELNKILARFKRAQMIPTLWMWFSRFAVVEMLRETGAEKSATSLQNKAEPGSFWFMAFTSGGWTVTKLSINHKTAEETGVPF